MKSKNELLTILDKLHEDDVKSVHDFIEYLIHKRSSLLVTDNDESALMIPGQFTWKDVTIELRKKISSPSYDTWFKHSSGSKTTPKEYTIYCQTDFQMRWIKEKYKNQINQIIDKFNGEHLEVNICVQGKPV